MQITRNQIHSFETHYMKHHRLQTKAKTCTVKRQINVKMN